MHNCTATIGERESHAAKIIPFHGLEKASGSQHTIQKEDLGRIRWLLVLKLSMHSASTKNMANMQINKKVHALTIFNLFPSILSTYCYVHMLPLKPLTDKQPSTRLTPCINVEKKMSTSRHLYMLSFFIATSCLLSCYFLSSEENSLLRDSHSTFTQNSAVEPAHAVRTVLCL